MNNNKIRFNAFSSICTRLKDRVYIRCHPYKVILLKYRMSNNFTTTSKRFKPLQINEAIIYMIQIIT